MTSARSASERSKRSRFSLEPAELKTLTLAKGDFASPSRGLEHVNLVLFDLISQVERCREGMSQADRGSTD